MGISQGDILDALDVSMNLSVGMLTPRRQGCMRKIPLLVTLAKKGMNSIVGCLLGYAVMAEEMDNIMRATIILRSVSEAKWFCDRAPRLLAMI
jgi:hypothetical protein